MDQINEVTGESTDITPLSMLQRAVVSGADIAVLERLMDLQERWQKNEARRSFTAALSRVRSEMPEILKTRRVDFTSRGGRTQYRYEDLAEVIAAVSPVLGKHGMSFRWRTNSDTAGRIAVTCILEHADGHAEETTLAAPIDESGNKNAVQAIGSVTTYLQRYTLKASLGIAAGADDDGRQGASTTSAIDETQQAQPNKPRVSEAQLALVRQLMKSHFITDEERVGIEKRLNAGILDGRNCIEWLKEQIETRKQAEVGPPAAEEGAGDLPFDDKVKPPDDEPVTSFTLAELQDVATRANITPEQVAAYVKEHYGRNKLEDLSETQAREMFAEFTK